MFRLVPAIGISVFTLASVTAAQAADWGDLDFKGSYDPMWGDLSDAGDPLDFDFGVRYSYTVGNRSMVRGGDSYDINDTGHALEVYGRIDDNSTGTYLRGFGGYSAIYEGTANTPLTGGNANIDSGYLGYAAADFGYLGYGDGAFRWGPFLGYQYTTQSATVEAAGETVEVDVHMMRLGVAARGEVGDNVDVNAELAFIPYGFQSGSASGGTNFDASLFGAAGELTIGFHPADNVEISVGGRASYLTDDFGGGGTDRTTDFRAGAILGIGYSF